MCFLKKWGFENSSQILDCVNENDVKFVNMYFTDIIGDFKFFSRPASVLDDVFSNGSGIDGSSIEGLNREKIEESDLIAKPDPKTFRVSPRKYSYKGKDYSVGMAICNIYNVDGTPNEGDSRYILQKTLRNLKDVCADSFKVGPEPEFFLFPDNKTNKPLDRDGYFGAMDDPNEVLRKNVMLSLDEMGIECEYDHHEVAKSQHEIDLKYGNAIETADNIMILKDTVKKTANYMGIHASFMPKPLDTENGNGMHLNQSLWKGKENLFYDEGSDFILSETAKKYLSGLIHNVHQITSVTNQYVNSYKRLQPGFEAPTENVWAFRNRSTLFRVPNGKGNSTRIEQRNPDPACNIYLALAVSLAAGVDGIKNDYELPAPVNEDVYKMSDKKKKRLGIESLPSSLDESLKFTEEGSLVKETLGNHAYKSFIQNRKKELNNYKDYLRKVSPYELKHNLPRL